VCKFGGSEVKVIYDELTPVGNNVTAGGELPSDFN
jgi:hypothetical protein